MIVVRVELHSAITGKVTELARMAISNLGTQVDPKLGDYVGNVLRRPAFKSMARTAHLQNYRRLGRPVWDLVTLMLKDMGYGK